MPLINPFIVVGTGRCGSSFVAKILHENLGVSMGTIFREPNQWNPEGYYEDMDFVSPNDMLISGDLTLQGWVKFINKAIQDRQAKKIKWGFKDPRIADLMGLYLRFFDNPRIIWCIRDKALVVNSLVNRYKMPVSQAEMQYESRMIHLYRTISDRSHLKIHFKGEQVSGEDVEELIWDKWPWVFS